MSTLGGTAFVNTAYTVGESMLRATILANVQTLISPIHTGLQTQEGLDDGSFPVFTRIDTSGPPRGGLGGDEYALLALAVLSTDHMETVDIDALGEPAAIMQYRVRLYSFVKADQAQDQRSEWGYQRVVRLRGLTEAAVRSVLLHKPSLGISSGSVRPDTVSTQFSDVQAVKGDRWVAAVYHEFIYQNEESASVGVQLGVADTFQVETAILGSDQ